GWRCRLPREAVPQRSAPGRGARGPRRAATGFSVTSSSLRSGSAWWRGDRAESARDVVDRPALRSDVQPPRTQWAGPPEGAGAYGRGTPAQLPPWPRGAARLVRGADTRRAGCDGRSGGARCRGGTG